MDAAHFIQLFPRLYHLTFACNIEGIRQHGLLSANALADLHAFTPEEREATLQTRRRCNQDLHGLTLRDQQAAPEAKMKSCLVRITIPEWLALLNGRIFFFLSEEKALRFAETYAGYDNLLFEVDTAALLATHAAHTTLCRINPGSFLYNPRPRGRDSFIPLLDYSYRKSRDTPAELILNTPVPNILQISSIRNMARNPGAELSELDPLQTMN